MMIAPVDDRHVDRLPSETLGRFEAAETGANNYYARVPGH
jgi:hypothetical protein